MSSMTTSSAFLPSAASRQRCASDSASASLSVPTVERVLAMPSRLGANIACCRLLTARPFLRAGRRVRETALLARACERLRLRAISLYQGVIDLHGLRRHRNAADEQVFH